MALGLDKEEILSTYYDVVSTYQRGRRLDHAVRPKER
jgi:hypothetical protein